MKLLLALLLLAAPATAQVRGVASVFCDLHMQSTNVGTKAKAPNFYV